MPTVPERAEVPSESTWNHESVFSSFDAWREEYGRDRERGRRDRAVSRHPGAGT